MKGKRCIIPIIAAIIVIASSIVDARLCDVTSFAKNSFVDGVDVSGLTLTEATAKLESELDKMSVAKDGVDPKEVSTPFKYGNAVGLHRKLVFSHIDARALIGVKKEYKLGLNVISGTEELAANLANALPSTEGELMTADAYIDYEQMTIIPEVQGENLDYTKLAKAVAAQRKTAPMNGTFAFYKKDYVLVPAVTSADLEEELAWAKEHLVKGIDIVDGNGNTVHVGSTQMSKLVIHNSKSVEYDKEAAMALADTLAGNRRPSRVRIQTNSGVKELYNYAISVSIDREKSADSILEAAKASVENAEPIVAQIYEDTETAVRLSTYVEVSTERQHLWYYRNGSLIIDSPVVTGMYGVHDTPHGIFRLAYKERSATLRGPNGDGTQYESHVAYWMPFNGGIGLHDAPWRGSFGGNIYIGDGSHGCVNLPHNTARTLYNELSSGSIIVVC